jgi:hypothetical protein
MKFLLIILPLAGCCIEKPNLDYAMAACRQQLDLSATPWWYEADKFNDCMLLKGWRTVQPLVTSKYQYERS